MQEDVLGQVSVVCVCSAAGDLHVAELEGGVQEANGKWEEGAERQGWCPPPRHLGMGVLALAPDPAPASSSPTSATRHQCCTALGLGPSPPSLPVERPRNPTYSPPPRSPPPPTPPTHPRYRCCTGRSFSRSSARWRGARITRRGSPTAKRRARAVTYCLWGEGGSIPIKPTALCMCEQGEKSTRAPFLPACPPPAALSTAP